jgi:hypothetical protein
VTQQNFLSRTKARNGKKNFSFFAELGLELRAYTFSHSTSTFFLMLGIFETGCGELFAWDVFKPQSS